MAAWRGGALTIASMAACASTPAFAHPHVWIEMRSDVVFNDDGLIKGTRESWKAYLGWAEFCRQVAQQLWALTGHRWGARDVEMAVWTAQRKSLCLPPLPAPHPSG